MNHILTFNVGDWWHPNARASVYAAAERWGAVVHELTEYPGYPHPFAAKFHLHRLGWSEGDRILYLDGDMVVRHDCPSPFDLVPADHFGAVRNYQGDTHKKDPEWFHDPSWQRACRDASSALGHKIKPRFSLDLYLNGGFLLWTAGLHDAVFELFRPVYGGMVPPGVQEQAAQSVALAHLGVPVTWLPREFNRVGPAVWTSGPAMECFVYHYASYLDWRGDMKRTRIAETRWEAS